jgi:hypothetical protein
MAWDPSDLQVRSVVPPSDGITNAQTKVKIKLVGAGFSEASPMFGVLVHHKRPQKRERSIPCNAIQTTKGDYEATLVICPMKKEAGAYDLILWKSPPAFVEQADDKAGKSKKHKNVPVNDVVIIPNAITVQEGKP